MGKPIIRSEHNMDLLMFSCGKEECKPDQAFGPAVRNHFLIHYGFEGKGIFRVGDKTYHLSKAEGFLICPNIITYYQADKDDPWVYAWIGFQGINAEEYLRFAGISQDKPIFTCPSGSAFRDLLNEIVDTASPDKISQIRIQGLLYIAISELIKWSPNRSKWDKARNSGEIHVSRAIEFIEANYSRSITVNQVAHYVGVDRSYLCRAFKQVIGDSPQKFIIAHKINKACDLLNNSSLSINQVSKSIGYPDPVNFSKMFSKIKGMSPTDYRLSCPHQKLHPAKTRA